MSVAAALNACLFSSIIRVYLCSRAFAPICLLEEVGAKYEVVDPTNKPANTFAVPCILSPSSGVAISQVTAIMRTLGHELGLAPTDAAADAKCLQLCCDGVDLVKEADAEGKVEGDRKCKWLNHFDGALSAPHPLNYADFAVMQALGLAGAFKSSSLAPADFPPGLMAWYKKMLETKGVKATLAKGTDMMPGGRPFPLP